MSFLFPAALVLLAFAGVILWLHVQRHRVRTVGSLHLWKRLQPQTSSRRPVFAWPRPSWLLALQLLTLVALVLALAQPWWGERAPDHQVIIVDNSSSMRTLEGDGDRWDLVINQAVKGVKGQQTVTLHSLIVAENEPNVLLARQRGEGAKLAELLDGVAPSDGRADWERVADLASAVVRAEETTEVLILTDGSDAGAEKLRDRFPSARMVAVGSAQPNVGLVAELAAVPDKPGFWKLAGAAHFSGGATSAVIEVGLQPDGAGSPLPWASHEVKLPNGADLGAPNSVDFAIELEFAGGGLLMASLPDDANGFDNVSRFVTRASAATHDVLYVGDGTQPLIAGLRAMEGVALYQAPDLPNDLSQFALVVIDDVEVARQPEVSTIWLAGARVRGEASPAISTDSDPVHWNGVHPLSRGIDWSALTVNESHFRSDDGAEVILASSAGALLTAKPTQWGGEIRLNFDPAATNWAAQPSFPAFVENVFSWLGLPRGIIEPVCSVGVECVVEKRLLGGMVSRLLADGWPPPQNIEPTFRPREAGLYRFERDNAFRLIAVNPADAGESVLTPVIEADTGDAPNPVGSLAPWLLAVALAVLLVEGWMAGRGPQRFLRRAGYAANNPQRGRHIVLLGLRLATVALVAFGLFNLNLRLPETIENVVLITDSAEHSLAATGSQRLAVVHVGDEGGIRQDLGESDLGSAPRGPLTLSDGIALASALLPTDQAGRLVLATASGAGNLDRLPTVAVDRLNVEPNETAVSIAGVQMPGRSYVGDQARLVVLVTSLGARQVDLALTQGEKGTVQQTIALRDGHNRIELDLPPAVEGENNYSLAITWDEGTATRAVHTTALRTPRLAIIAAEADAGAAFAAALDELGADADVLTPQQSPRRLDLMLDYDAIALMNVPSVDLSTFQQSLIHQAVEEHGRGLFILGGENSFGPGGYLETVLDRMSPISSKVPREAPRAAMAFVLDRSGSMIQAVGNSTRLDIAKAATLAAAGLLNEESQVGIVVFDSEARAILPLQPLDLDAASTALKQLDAGGGTAIYPGLSLAFEQLRGVDEPTRHVVVMTDGLSTPGDFPALLAEMRAAGISVSTVAIGEGADSNELRNIAASGGGVYHSTRDFEALPSILSQEAMQLSGAPIEERQSAPYWRDRRASFLSGLPSRMPLIHGYVLTTAKPEADLHLAVTDSEGAEMPLMASWNYGTGRVLALTTHGAGRWTREWIGKPEHNLLWTQAVRQFLPNRPGSRFDTEFRQVGDWLEVIVTASEAQGVPLNGATLGAVAQMPDGTSRDVHLLASGGGRYTARIPAVAEGIYRLEMLAGDERLEARTFVALGEHAGDGPALKALVAGTGGRYLAVGETPFTAGTSVWTERAGWPLWTVLALVVFLADLMLRYGVSKLWNRPGRAGAQA
jgi:uncharacterized protein YegL